jgi:hypothetical protein
MPGYIAASVRDSACEGGSVLVLTNWRVELRYNRPAN